jgi:serine/threonine protein kinase
MANRFLHVPMIAGAAPPPFRPYNHATLALTPGTRLGVYEVSAPIGKGGMGQVYRAPDTRLDPDVAVKMVQNLEPPPPSRLVLVSNWLDELRRRVPVR